MTYTERQVRTWLKRVAVAAGGQSALARRWRIARPYLADIIAGRERPNPTVLRRLGLRRVVVYVDRARN